ncbi:MAG: hypothetical protein J07HX64_01402 [halophilic archaeon J07HX64]|jgi:Uncharacterized low-complexity proteins|nr:MAG: hypothetical protein J07HX64_01402 [halophilic archaeon J07HX64]
MVHSNRCGYTYIGESGRESCCYRETWDDRERCIWHEEIAADETKPVEQLERARAPPEVRDLNGETGPREILDGTDVRGTVFPDGMDLAGVSLRDTDMAEVGLRNATLTGASLADATLVDADLRGADLRGANCWEAELNDIHLGEATLEGADLRAADCSDAILRAANLEGANLEGAFFDRADLFDATLSRTRSYGAVFSEARANEGTELDERCVYDHNSDADATRQRRESGAVRSDGGQASDTTVAGSDIDPLTKAEATYQELESLCSENALLSRQSQYFVRRQDIHTEEHWREGNWSRWLRARLSRAVVLYGESPFRVLSVTVAIIVGSALLYPLGLLRVSATGQPLMYPSPTEPIALVSTLIDSLYFSVLTFTTMTFGLYSPVGAGKLLTMLETSAGIVLMALLVFVFGRRATR